MNVALIGAGLIGQAWAIVFSRAGCQVEIWDADGQALREAVAVIGRQLHELQNRHLVPDAAVAVARVHAAQSLDAALAAAQYVQENLPEKLELKKEIFAKLDALSRPEAILASSTSSIPASAFTEGLAGRHRCLVAHPVNPPYLIPVVELCGAPWTSPEALDKARSVMLQVGQKPVVVHKELEGFVLNRLQGALLREAFRLVEDGCISVEDLDITVKDGLGLRWSFMGPFETIDLNAPGGLRDYCQRYGGLYQSISTQQASTESWTAALIEKIEKQRRSLLPQNELLQRRQWRDDRLMELIVHKQKDQATGKD